MGGALARASTSPCPHATVNGTPWTPPILRQQRGGVSVWEEIVNGCQAFTMPGRRLSCTVECPCPAECTDRQGYVTRGPSKWQQGLGAEPGTGAWPVQSRCGSVWALILGAGCHRVTLCVLCVAYYCITRIVGGTVGGVWGRRCGVPFPSGCSLGHPGDGRCTCPWGVRWATAGIIGGFARTGSEVCKGDGWAVSANCCGRGAGCRASRGRRDAALPPPVAVLMAVPPTSGAALPGASPAGSVVAGEKAVPAQCMCALKGRFN